MCLSSARLAVATSTPSMTREPALGGSIMVTTRASVDFPQPGFADDGEGLAGFEREAHAVDGAELQRLGEGAATEAVVAADVLGPHDERLGHHATAGSGLGWPTGRPWVSG